MQSISSKAPTARAGLKALPARATRSAVVVRAQKQSEEPRSLKLNSTLAPLYTVAAAEGLRRMLTPQADYFNTLGLPEALVHWGHPGNMMVVLLAMGGYGAGYLGWAIRNSDDEELVEKAKDMHPKLATGMFVFFSLGAIGGMLSLVMQGKPIFESPHVWTGLGGLSLLALQAMLPLFFEEDPKLKTTHAFLGTGILGLFAVHAALGIQLGLSI